MSFIFKVHEKYVIIPVPFHVTVNYLLVIKIPINKPLTEVLRFLAIILVLSLLESALIDVVHFIDSTQLNTLYFFLCKQILVENAYKN